MKVLAYINHFFGRATGFRGKSTTQVPDRRRGIVEAVCDSLSALPAQVDVFICGDGRNHLLEPHIRFTELTDPRHLPYASIQHQVEHASEYDYFVNVEDDVRLPLTTWQAVLQFDAEYPIDCCLLPNRLERTDGGLNCVDLKVTPGWTEETLPFRGHTLRVAMNPHSGIAILSSAKLLYARARVDFARRDVFVGGLMASAYANLHSAFSLYRPFDDLTFAHVEHLDPWEALPQRR